MSADTKPPSVAEPPSDPANDSSVMDTDIEKDPEQGDVPAPVPAPPPRTISGFRWGVVVLAILSSIFLFALDNTVVADVQPQIVLQFDAVGKIAWLGVAFIMAALSTNLLFGRLYSQLQPKWLYIGSVVLFEAGSVVCGAAPSMDALIVGRALCGLGGMGMYLGVMALLAYTTTIEERPMYLGMAGLVWGIGTVLGPVVGGGFADNASTTWR